MKSERKFFLDKKEDLDSIVDRLINTRATKVILSIPKDSILGSSLNNFEVLKREAATANKELSIESIDDHILQLASVAKINALNPIFHKIERPVSDILPIANFQKETIKKEEIIEEFKPRKQEESAKPKLKFKRERHYRIKVKKGLILKLTGLVIILLLLVWPAIHFLPKTEIQLSIKRTTVDFNEIIEVNKEASEFSISFDKITLPGELLIAHRNLQMMFPANAQEQIESKAKGKLIIHNNFSSEFQVLVATTRFESPEGKIFRLNNRVIIPGAKVVNGQIIPSTLEVQVTADQPGEDYNIQPSSGWKIPGFKGSPKYNSFFAEAPAAMTGGFIGQKSVPTSDDIIAAKISLKGTLEDSLKGQMLLLNSERFKLFDEAINFTLLKEEVYEVTNTEGNFSVFAEAELRYLVFDEEMFQQALLEKIKEQFKEELEIVELNINFENIESDLIAGTMTFITKGSVVLMPPLDVDKWRKNILGLREERLISDLPGFEGAKISFWPFWVHKVPQREGRVRITIK